MSIISLLLLILIFLFFILYLYLKRRLLNKLNDYVKKNNGNEIRSLLTEKHTHFFLSEYICDLYFSKSFLIDQDIKSLKKKLREMFKKDYQKTENNDYLSLYYHYFINRKDEPFIDEMLERIEKEHDVHLFRYCTWTKLVLIKHNNNLISEMEEAIEHKDYSGFPLGVITYLIGIQYEALQKYSDALLWYETAITVFQKKDFYYNNALMLAKNLNERLEKNDNDLFIK